MTDASTNAPQRSRCGFISGHEPLTEQQRRAFVDLACSEGWSEFHFGDNVGADEDAFWLLVESGGGGVLHAWLGATPVECRANLAERAPELGVVIHQRMQAVNRNLRIIDHADVLIVAIPASRGNRTIVQMALRQARSRQVERIIVIQPDGDTITELADDRHAGAA